MKRLGTPSQIPHLMPTNNFNSHSTNSNCKVQRTFEMIITVHRNKLTILNSKISLKSTTHLFRIGNSELRHGQQWCSIFQLNCFTSEKLIIILENSVFICWQFFVVFDICWPISFKWCKSFEMSSIIVINNRIAPMAKLKIGTRWKNTGYPDAEK